MIEEATNELRADFMKMKNELGKKLDLILELLGDNRLVQSKGRVTMEECELDQPPPDVTNEKQLDKHIEADITENVNNVEVDLRTGIVVSASSMKKHKSQHGNRKHDPPNNVETRVAFDPDTNDFKIVAVEDGEAMCKFCRHCPKGPSGFCTVCARVHGSLIEFM